MSIKKNRGEVRCYDYVNHPYERVRDVLKHNAVTVFQSATKAAFRTIDRRGTARRLSRHWSEGRYKDLREKH